MPVFSASMDPDVYQMISCRPPDSNFGALPGYRTTEGVVSVPTSPVQGWTYSPEPQRWLLHASPNPARRSTARRGGPGTSRGEERRKKTALPPVTRIWPHILVPHVMFTLMSEFSSKYRSYLDSNQSTPPQHLSGLMFLLS